MRMMQYDVKLNRDDGTGYYVSSCNDEEKVRLFSDKGQPIEMKILTCYDDLIPCIDTIGGSKEFREELEKEFQDHLKEIFLGEYLDWRLVNFEVCTDSVILGYYKPDGGLDVSVALSAVNVFQAEFYVPGRDENHIEKYTIRQNNEDYGNGIIHSHANVVEQINGVRRDLRFTSYSDEPLEDGFYVTITEYVG